MVIPRDPLGTVYMCQNVCLIAPCPTEFELRVPLVSTVNNYADFFTKPLKSKAFLGLRNKIMNIA